MPGLSWEDAGKVAVKLRQWAGLARQEPGAVLPENLSVVTPAMVPGFRRRWQRGLNRRLMARKLHGVLGPRRPGEQRIAITTLPITADLVGTLDVDRWVYYCVDDFSQWPGLDGATLEALDRELIAKVDRVVCVSETLRQRVAGLGKASELLTHGIDLEHWSSPSTRALPEWWARVKKPVYLFWGLVDRRLDTAWCLALAARGGTLVLVGPRQSPDETLARAANILMPGPLAYEALPGVAAAADVLVMPYADLLVTRAMQPLKFKEYLATGKPVAARRLPSVAEWHDAADLAVSAEGFVSLAEERGKWGLSALQVEARKRLARESWEIKARDFEKVIVGESGAASRGAS